MGCNFTTLWAADRIADLKRYWSEGYSCSQIAAKMGGGLTRNAIIGKAHRLDLPGRRSGANKNGSTRTINPVRPDPARIPRKLTQKTVFQSRERKPRARFINPNAKPALVAVVSVFTGQMISVAGRRRGPAPEMTKNELRNQLATAMLNTAALEILT